MCRVFFPPYFALRVQWLSHKYRYFENTTMGLLWYEKYSQRWTWTTLIPDKKHNNIQSSKDFNLNTKDTEETRYVIHMRHWWDKKKEETTATRKESESTCGISNGLIEEPKKKKKERKAMKLNLPEKTFGSGDWKVGAPQRARSTQYWSNNLAKCCL